MESSPKWALEDALLNIYWLLVHRLKGLSWSLKDFWEADTWTTSKLYCMELDLIEYENNDGKGKSNPEQYNSPEIEELHERMFNNGR